MIVLQSVKRLLGRTDLFGCTSEMLQLEFHFNANDRVLRHCQVSRIRLCAFHRVKSGDIVLPSSFVTSCTLIS